MIRGATEGVKERVARKRQRARDAGLCYECYRSTPNPGRTVCVDCRALKTQRKKQKRQRERESVNFRYYLGTIETTNTSVADRELMLSTLGSNPRNATKAVEALLQIYAQLRFDCKGGAMLAAILFAAKLAEISRDIHLIRLTQLRKAEALQILCRFEEAREVLREIGVIAENEDPLLRCLYFTAHAWDAGAVGDMASAYEKFELALELTKQNVDPYLVTVVWLRYGYVAQELGDTERAKGCYEQALFVALQYGITHVTSRLRLFYAQLLASMGQATAAHAHLVEALSSSPSIPFLDVNQALLGIPLALQIQDETILAQCANPKAIELAFQSEMPDAIGGVANGFAQLYASQADPYAAEMLLHRALERITYANFNLDVLIAISRYGALTDVPRARALLVARVDLPHASIFEAGLALFDAFVERRQGSLKRARALGREAGSRFRALQWHGYAEIARSIAPLRRVFPKEGHSEQMGFSHMEATLSVREREVASLVLQGLTNREIASELSIALHTVEKHMNSILNRLGIRSRYQVADFLESASHEHSADTGSRDARSSGRMLPSL